MPRGGRRLGAGRRKGSKTKKIALVPSELMPLPPSRPFPEGGDAIAVARWCLDAFDESFIRSVFDGGDKRLQFEVLREARARVYGVPKGDAVIPESRATAAAITQRLLAEMEASGAIPTEAEMERRAAIAAEKDEARS